MATVRVVVFNSDETYGAELRAALLGFKGLKIVAEVDEPSLLPQAVERFPCDLLVANLDPIPEVVLPIVGDIASSTNISVFAISESTDGQLILAAMRHGVREFLTKPIENAVLHQALGKVSERGSQTGEPGSLITVIGGAGGVGATCLSVNLATELNELTPGKVTIVDLDHRFGQVATHLDVDPTYTIADLCDSPGQLDQQMIERALMKHPSGLQILSRPLHFEQADNITAAHCVGVLTALTTMNDFVIVDGPTRFDYGTKAVLDIADLNLLVLQLVVPTVRSVHRMLDGMKRVGFNLDRMKLICNRVGCEGVGVSIEDVSSTLNLEIFGEVPDDWATVNGAINVGEPLSASAPKSKVRLSIKDVAARIAGAGANTQQESEHKKGGLLGRIF